MLNCYLSLNAVYAVSRIKLLYMKAFSLKVKDILENFSNFRMFTIVSISNRFVS